MPWLEPSQLLHLLGGVFAARERTGHQAVPFSTWLLVFMPPVERLGCPRLLLLVSMIRLWA